MVNIPPIDTFEHDIADEIRNKEASIEDIVSATGDVGNDKSKDTPGKSNSALISIVVMLILSGLVGAGYLGYIYFIDGPISETKAQEEIATQKEKLNPGIKLSSVSPALDQAVGSFLTNVKKSGAGYTIDIVSYSPVFSYMIKNEQEFGDELGLALGNSHTAATSTPPLKRSAPVIASTTTSTSTDATSTESKPIEVDEVEELSTSYVFSDITLSNQNMRIATSIYGTVVYAFIGTNRLVISQSTDGILQLRSNDTSK
ncbi:MAG: hypothetical protein K9L31_01720 [Candidatus Pacebacteria bacterium]|nr:hypothetical protein [Candidatus Paceibacterota bacterium]